MLHGLSDRVDGQGLVPKLRRVRCDATADRLLVRMLPGQSPEDYERAAEALAHASRTRDCRVRVHKPGWIWLELSRLDTLAIPVPALPVPERPDLSALRLGVTESGTPWLLRLLGTHVLIAGVTGAGKSSALWSTLRAICPLIHDGTVQVWALDPKGGMELAPGRALFTRFADGDHRAMLDVLEAAVTLMRERAARLAGAVRQHVPTPADPLVLVAVDELANLTAYLPDRKMRDQFAAAISMLLSQGRAVGVNVIGALQDPRKDVLPFRNLFPTKIGLRLDERVQVDMVLGEGARLRGAYCDRIPESTPGVGYVRLDGLREPVRVRAGHVTDADIAQMARDHAAPPPLRPVANRPDERTQAA